MVDATPTPPQPTPSTPGETGGSSGPSTPTVAPSPDPSRQVTEPEAEASALPTPRSERARPDSSEERPAQRPRLDLSSNAAIQRLDGMPRHWQLETGRWRVADQDEPPGPPPEPASS
eukprot:14004113-Alexandrium_andersonii.AAC.1